LAAISFEPKNASFWTPLLQIGQPQVVGCNCLNSSIKELLRKKLGMRIAL
jgi:hypothetical protein